MENKEKMKKPEMEWVDVKEVVACSGGNPNVGGGSGCTGTDHGSCGGYQMDKR